MSLVIILSSFIVSSASTYVFTTDKLFNTNINNSILFQEAYLANNGIDIPDGSYTVKNGYGTFPGNQMSFIMSFYQSSEYKISVHDHINNTNYMIGADASKFPVYIYPDGETININGAITIQDPAIKTVSINPTQMIVFNYLDSNKLTFLKGLRVTPNKGIILQQGYYLDGDLSSLAIRKDNSGFLAGGLFNNDSLSLSDFPLPRTLNTNEYLAFFQSYDNIGLSPLSSADKLAYFEIDTNKCSYKIIDRFSGVVADGITTPGITAPGDITTSSDGYSGITPDYELQRGEFADGILGTIQFIIADFVNMISSLFTLGLSAISTLVTNGSAFMGSIVSMFSWLPGPVAVVIQSGLILLVIIGVFKMFL